MKSTDKQKVVAFDLDDVLCSRPKGIEHLGVDKYKQCFPNMYYVNMMNGFYDQGYHIKIYTARGMTSLKGDVKQIYKELYEPTLIQLEAWGAKFHTLVMGKEHFDVLIDDKAINSYEDNLYEQITDILG
jgi:hypothetical protein